jgi:ATP-dependent exoDNAse (exonuclease V) alpha subunit
MLRDKVLRLDRQAIAIVDEAGMVGTDDFRQLLTATTAAGAKTVLVGDAHQLSPVKARGGMFAQLSADLPWTQRLSEVWRMNDPAERVTSLALRNGGPAPVRRAVDWYRKHERLRAGDPIAMAHDAQDAYRADTAAGRDALLVCDTKEMADVLNRRLHDQTVASCAPTVTAARGHHIAVGDLIISRRNDSGIEVFDASGAAKSPDPVRNGNRWRVAALDVDTGRVAAQRVADGARVVFDGDYVQKNITHGYAVTVHSAQGVTCDTSHAVLGESISRTMLYVAMTRGRESNIAYLYERMSGEGNHDHRQPDVSHVMRRSSGRHAAQLLRSVIANHDDQARTAHDVAAETQDRGLMPDRVRRLLDCRARAGGARLCRYRDWAGSIQPLAAERDRSIDHHIGRGSGFEHDIDL